VWKFQFDRACFHRQEASMLVTTYIYVYNAGIMIRFKGPV